MKDFSEYMSGIIKSMSYEEESKLLQAKILDFRQKLKKFVTLEDTETLKDYVKYNYPPEEIEVLIRQIENNPIIKLYDEYFDIQIKRTEEL